VATRPPPRQPAWVDRVEYPFPPRWMPVDGGTLHYLDEGDGPPVLLVHGTPTWSFLWRHLISALRPVFRCVAPDHLGFGLSRAEQGADLRPEAHAARLAALAAHLGLERPHLVVHDVGGPIALGPVIEGGLRAGRVVLFNTWLWSLLDDRRLARGARVLGSHLGRFLYLRLNFSARVLMPRAAGRSAPLEPRAYRQYLAAQADRDARRGAFAIARSLVGSHAWMRSLWARRDRLRDLKALAIWGMEDPVVAPAYLARWREVWPDLAVREVPDAGHWVADVKGRELAPAVRGFLTGT
jgi:pimeloyl-ACP methyl ester carboxylesterase